MRHACVACGPMRTPTSQVTPAALTIEEAAQYLGIGRTLAYRLARDGRLKTLRLGKTLRVPKVWLDERLAEGGSLESLQTVR